MKQLVFFVGFVLSFFHSSAQLIFEMKEVEFPDLIEGDSARIVFKYKNNSNSTVRFQKLAPGCGCTSASTNNMVISPFASDSIVAIFHSAGGKGHIHKDIELVYTDGNDSVYVDRLYLHGNILPKPLKFSETFIYKSGPLMMVTPIVFFGDVSKSKNNSAILRLGWDGKKPTRLRVVSKPKYVKVKRYKMYPGVNYTFKVTMKKRKLDKKGLIEDNLIIGTKGSTDVLEMTIRLYNE